ncbi:type II toxin-antitoxin system death-on-curing family toxin [Amycolatopsis jejuensis]|uniref:type II toxin-antitoxin system death-on-curing family toxin n=1 Tax=Amycolatopsis jejuensis TaxID=330084 RepID=UPI000A7663CE|nr:type II toxin-antitoxin system death-on-curing family toxin [Amycolatopsis jejuensis]
MIHYLDLGDVQEVMAIVLGSPALIRDHGLLASALARPQSTVFGQDAYPDLFDKAAALLHSLARNHAMQDGNKRAAWNCAIVFLDINGHPLAEPLDVDKAENMVLNACQGRIDVPEISAALRGFVQA